MSRKSDDVMEFMDKYPEYKGKFIGWTKKDGLGISRIEDRWYECEEYLVNLDDLKEVVISDSLDYRLTIHPIMDTSIDAFTAYRFGTEKEMLAGKNVCADLLLYLQDKLKAMDDESNMFVCEKLVDGEWEDIEEDF